MYDLSEHGSLMGCSIQPDPKAKNAAKVEAKVGFGLHQRHAYSITGVYEIEFNEGEIKEFYTKLQQIYNKFKKIINEIEDSSSSSIRKHIDQKLVNQKNLVKKTSHSFSGLSN